SELPKERGHAELEMAIAGEQRSSVGRYAAHHRPRVRAVSFVAVAMPAALEIREALPESFEDAALDAKRTERSRSHRSSPFARERRPRRIPRLEPPARSRARVVGRRVLLDDVLLNSVKTQDSVPRAFRQVVLPFRLEASMGLRPADVAALEARAVKD